MQADKVKLRQIWSVAKIRKTFIEQMGMGSGCLRQFTGKSGLCGIEVGASPFIARARCMNIGTDTKAKAQLTTCAR